MDLVGGGSVINGGPTPSRFKDGQSPIISLVVALNEVDFHIKVFNAFLLLVRILPTLKFF